jgi:hypothetical protein
VRRAQAAVLTPPAHLKPSLRSQRLQHRDNLSVVIRSGVIALGAPARCPGERPSNGRRSRPLPGARGPLLAHCRDFARAVVLSSARADRRGEVGGASSARCPRPAHGGPGRVTTAWGSASPVRWHSVGTGRPTRREALALRLGFAAPARCTEPAPHRRGTVRSRAPTRCPRR